MANQIHPYQPISFEEHVDPCLTTTSRWAQKSLPTDTPVFQMELGPCDDARDILGAVSVGNPGDWTNVGSEWCHSTPGVADDWDAVADVIAGELYEIKFTITDMTAGTISVLSGADSVATVTENGEYTYYHNQVSNSPDRLRLSVSADFDGCIDSYTMLIVEKRVKVWLMANGVIDTSTILDESSSDFNYTNQFLTVTIDWAALGITSGCYQIGVADPCLNTCSQIRISDEEFFDQSAWTVTTAPPATWNIASGVANFAATGLGTAEMAHLGVLCSGASYKITFTLGSMADNTFQFNLGGTGGSVYNADGTYTETIIAGGSGKFAMLGTTIVGPVSAFTVTNMTVERIDSELTADFTSCVINVDNHLCTHLVKMYNDSNAFNFNFTNFQPTMRVDSKVFPVGYEQDREGYEESDGTSQQSYLRQKRKRKLQVIQLPEIGWDFLSLISGMDNVFVDTDEYTFPIDEDFPEPDYGQMQYYGAGDIMLVQKTELMKKADCT